MSKIYGYCRVSTRKQSIDRQERNIKSKYPESFIVKDVYTGTTMDRPNWQRLMHIIKSGDTIVFDEVSRMSRNAEEGYETYQQLFNGGISLVFLKEEYLNTDTYKKNMDKQIQLDKNGIGTTGAETTDKLIKSIVEALSEYMRDLTRDHIKAAFKQSQNEVDYLRRRTKEGIESARLKGKQIGRPKGKKCITKKEKERKPEILRLSRDFNGSNTDAEVIRLLGMDKNTYYKYKRELRQNFLGR